jgi:hypothetical protein
MLRKALGTVIGGVLALASVGLVPQARAEERNQVTEFTFNQPVRLPENKVLPAGSYWFTVPDAINGGRTVQVLNSKRTRVLGTFETETMNRPGNTTISPTIGDVQLKMVQMPNQPAIVIGWIYPEQLQGHEFQYSAQRESQMAESGYMLNLNIPNGGTASGGTPSQEVAARY